MYYRANKLMNYYKHNLLKKIKLEKNVRHVDILINSLKIFRLEKIMLSYIFSLNKFNSNIFINNLFHLIIFILNNKY